MTLLEEIQAKCSPEMIASKEHGAIAAFISVGRKKPSGMEIGNGTILDILGLQAGNAVLDAIHSAPEYRHAIPLLEQGRLVVSSPIVLGALQAMVQGEVITQADADKLIALAIVDGAVDTNAVIAAMEGL